MTALLLIAALLAPTTPPVPPTPTPTPTMAEFVAVDLEGNTVEPATLRGKPVLLNFWASWCTPCVAELPIITAIHTQYGPLGLQVVGVSFDEDPATTKATVKKLGLTFPNLLDPTGQTLGKAFKVMVLPTTVLYTADGKQLWRKDRVLEAREKGLGAAIQKALETMPPKKNPEPAAPTTLP